MPLSNRSWLRPCVAVFLVGIAGFGCASKRPVLYPNAHYTAVGNRQAEDDVDDCLSLASAHGLKPNSGGQVAGGTVQGAAVGAATGAAVGAVVVSAGRGAAAGSAGGAAGGLVRSMFRVERPDQVTRNFVNRCLQDRGYEPIGWRS